MVLHCVTVATHRSLAWTLEKSCWEQGINLTVLGENVKWEGFCTKFDVLLKWLRSATLDDTDIVLFSDGYDTFCQQSAAQLQICVDSMPKDKLIVSAEYYLWPPQVFHLKSIFQDRAPVGSRHIFPCSGQYCGSVKVLKDCIDLNLCKAHKDDQAAIVLFCAANPEKVVLDYRLQLFHPNILALKNHSSAYDGNIVKEWGVDPSIVLTRGRGSVPLIRLKSSSTSACFVHANGAPQSQFMDLINGVQGIRTGGGWRWLGLVCFAILLATLIFGFFCS